MSKITSLKTNSTGSSSQNESEPADRHSSAFYIGKGLASVAICALGGVSMWITDGDTGIGWAIIGLIVVW